MNFISKSVKKLASLTIALLFLAGISLSGCTAGESGTEEGSEAATEEASGSDEHPEGEGEHPEGEEHPTDSTSSE